jgi:choline dehydrogenase-like flavoprotein
MSTSAFLPPAERQTLEAVCDAFVPSIRAAGTDDPTGLLSRAASDLDVAGLLVEALAAEPADALPQFRRLLRLLGSPGFAGGAAAMSTTHSSPLRLERVGGRPGAIGVARLERFLGDIERRGVIANQLPLYSAHQMGSCRLGANKRTSVADPYGEVHGVKGLFIADASGFPSASGVNPMLSVMALAYRVAQRINAS